MSHFTLTSDDITDGPIPRALLVLTAPLFVQNFVRVLQQLVDLFWVGHYSADAVAAVGLATPVVSFLLVSTISAAFIGTQVLVSQRVGADDHRGARRAAFTGLVVTVILSIVVGLLIYFNIGILLELMASTRPNDVGANVAHLATAYLEVLAVGIIFAGMSDVIEAAFIARGDSRAALYLNVASVVGNIGLDPVFIFGMGPIPEMGIHGAALATVAGYGAGFLLGAVFVARGRAGGIYSWESAKIKLDEFRLLLDIGLPKAVQGASGTTASLLIVLIVFAAAGAPGLTAVTVGSRVYPLAFRPLLSLSQATQSIVGQNLGANNPDRAAKTTWVAVGIGVSVLLLLTTVQWIASGAITHLLVPGLDGTAFALAVAYLQILAIGYPAEAILTMLKAGFDGARLTKTSMVVSLVRRWGLEIPLGFLGGIVFGYGAIGVFWAQTVATVLVTVAFTGYYIYRTNDGLYVRAAEKVEGTQAD